MEDLLAADGEPCCIGGAREARQLFDCPAAGRVGAVDGDVEAVVGRMTVTCVRRLAGFSAARAMAAKRCSREAIAGTSTGHSSTLKTVSLPRRLNPRMIPFCGRTAEKTARRRLAGGTATTGSTGRRNTALCEGGLDLPAFPREIGLARHVLERAAAADAEMAAERRHAVGARCDDIDEPRLSPRSRSTATVSPGSV